jgi:hypothetical protein
MSAYRFQTPPIVKELTLNERVQSYLDAIPGAVSGENGHSQTLKVATALVIGFALLLSKAKA